MQSKIEIETQAAIWVIISKHCNSILEKDDKTLISNIEKEGCRASILAAELGLEFDIDLDDEDFEDWLSVADWVKEVVKIRCGE